MKKLLLFLLAAACLFLLYRFNFLPHPSYSDRDFGIETWISDRDADGDGIDDQSDILLSAKEYLDTKPVYKSKYYDTGYPDDEYGVCTDVVAFALKGAGYDLKELVYRDVMENRGDYTIETVDANIDFRRVRNLKVFLDRNCVSLTTDLSRIAEWQAGDIVVFKGHIGLLSDKRNRHGVPYVLHHAWRWQPSYEEDILEQRDDITGHYRFRLKEE